MVTASHEVKEEGSGNADELANSIYDIITSILRQIQPTVEDEGISKPQFLAMHVLTTNDTASVSTVARQLAVTAPTACVTVDQLEAAGLVEKHRSARDHRTVEVSLTPKGRRVEARVWGKIGRQISEAVRGMPADELAMTVRLLHELNRRLNKVPYSRSRKN